MQRPMRACDPPAGSLCCREPVMPLALLSRSPHRQSLRNTYWKSGIRVTENELTSMFAQMMVHTD